MLVNVPAALIVHGDHVAALHGVTRERRAPTTSWSSSSCSSLGALRRASAPCTSTSGQLHAVRAERLHAASIRAPRSCSSRTSASTRSRPRPRRRSDPQRNMPIGILGGLAICTVIYVDRRHRAATGLVPYKELERRRSAGATRSKWPACRSRLDSSRSAPSISLTAVLLVFQYGQPRIFFAMARDGLLPKWAARVASEDRIPYITTVASPASSWPCACGDRRRERDLRPHEHRHALRVHPRLRWRAGAARQESEPAAAVQGPVRLGRSRRSAWLRAVRHDGPADTGVGAVRAGGWLIGLVLYFVYGYRHSKLRSQR